MHDFQSDVAVIAGGASGLGAATAQFLANQGMKVAIFDMNSELGQAHPNQLGGLFCKVDVADAASVADGIARVEAHLGNPRVLVNCAGIGPAAKTVSRGLAHDPEMFQKTIMINLVGTFDCASQAAARMAAAEPKGPDRARGVIINTASVATYDGQIGQVAYAVSKGGIVGMTLPMARDLADKGVRVCAVAPGLFLTPLLAGLPEDVQQSLGQQVPLPSRLGNPNEFAELVGHVIANPMLNGEVIRLDGAIRMAPR